MTVVRPVRAKNAFGASVREDIYAHEQSYKCDWSLITLKPM